MNNIYQSLRKDPRFSFISSATLKDISEVAILQKFDIKQVRLCGEIPKGLWYSEKLGQRIYVVDDGSPVFRPINNPNLIIDRSHVTTQGIKKVPKYFKHLLNL